MVEISSSENNTYQRIVKCIVKELAEGDSFKNSLSQCDTSSKELWQEYFGQNSKNTGGANKACYALVKKVKSARELNGGIMSNEDSLSAKKECSQSFISVLRQEQDSRSRQI